MDAAHKIIKILGNMQADISALKDGQNILQGTVDKQGKQLANLQTDVTGITGRMDTLEHGQKSLVEGQKSLEAGQKVLQTDVKSLKDGQETLELKVEAFHSEQKRANTEIISTLHEIGEVNAKETDKRIGRIERHLNLQPVK